MAEHKESPLALARLPESHQEMAPDGSEIRWLARVAGGSMVHCTLRQGLSMAVTHHTVEEIWYFVAGQGEVWRKRGDEERIDPVGPGSSLTIPLGTHFQFRNTGTEPLCFLCVTLPPWPGEDEARRVSSRWEA